MLWSAVGAGWKRAALLLPKYADNNELACKWRQRGSAMEGGGVERGGVGGWLYLSLLAAPGSRRSSPLHTLYPAESFLHQTNSYNCPRRGTSNDSYFISAASWQMTMQLGWIRILFINLWTPVNPHFSLSISTNTFKVQRYFCLRQNLFFLTRMYFLKINAA